ncbi:hypothetical protein Tco_0416217, partial [Tanacetum coccineum]
NKNGRMMLESIENGPLVYPAIEENGQIRNKKYAEVIEQDVRIKSLLKVTAAKVCVTVAK